MVVAEERHMVVVVTTGRRGRSGRWTPSGGAATMEVVIAVTYVRLMTIVGFVVRAIIWLVWLVVLAVIPAGSLVAPGLVSGSILSAIVSGFVVPVWTVVAIAIVVI